MTLHRFSRTAFTLVLLFVFAACSSPGVAPPATYDAVMVPGDDVAGSDHTAAATVTGYRYHVMPAIRRPGLQRQSIVYPGDMQYYGGHVIPNAHVDNIFINSTAFLFGSPNSFEEHLSYSGFAHVLDQYVHATGPNRYDWEGDIKLNFANVGIVTDVQMLGVVHHVAAQLKRSGYGHIYNVFLPPGINVCLTGQHACNATVTSPYPSFCAYHGSGTFEDTGHVVFTVEPYQDPTYCGEPDANPTPNGVNDYTYSTLSHELFETITDPDPGSGWIDTNAGVHGEIGDLCAYLPSTDDLDGKAYYLQREYSNAQHGCVDAAP